MSSTVVVVVVFAAELSALDLEGRCRLSALDRSGSVGSSPTTACLDRSPSGSASFACPSPSGCRPSAERVADRRDEGRQLEDRCPARIPAASSAAGPSQSKFGSSLSECLGASFALSEPVASGLV